MKAIWFFNIGAGIDILAVLIALYFVVTDSLSGTSGTNNPSMYKAILAMLALIAVAFWLRHLGKIVFANILLWVPALPLAIYAIMILMFVIFKPKI